MFYDQLFETIRHLITIVGCVCIGPVSVWVYRQMEEGKPVFPSEKLEIHHTRSDKDITEKKHKDELEIWPEG